MGLSVQRAYLQTIQASSPIPRGSPKTGKGSLGQFQQGLLWGPKARGRDKEVPCGGPACIFTGAFPAVWRRLVAVLGSQQHIKM